jgi:hypothetical protein
MSERVDGEKLVTCHGKYQAYGDVKCCCFKGIGYKNSASQNMKQTFCKGTRDRSCCQGQAATSVQADTGMRSGRLRGLNSDML